MGADFCRDLRRGRPASSGGGNFPTGIIPAGEILQWPAIGRSAFSRSFMLGVTVNSSALITTLGG
jgi:hypothetical protein